MDDKTKAAHAHISSTCPICHTQWLSVYRKPGQECLDQSQGQKRPCVGRVILTSKWERAERRAGITAATS